MEVYIAEIRSMVEDSYTHEQISEFLQQQNYEVHGLSARSVRRFCSAHNIHYRSNPGRKIGGVTLPICAVIKLEWAVIKSKLGSVE